MEEDDRRPVALVEVREPQAVEFAIVGLEREVRAGPRSARRVCERASTLTVRECMRERRSRVAEPSVMELTESRRSEAYF